MRSLVLLALAWTIGSTVTGVLGSLYLKELWKTRIESELQRASRSVQTIVEKGEWETPVQEDPDWIAMEMSLRVAIVPIPGSSDRLAETPIWSRESLNGYKVVKTVDCEPNPSSVERLQISLVPAPAREVTVWWRGWLLLNLAALCFCAATIWHLRTEAAASQRLLDPWVASVQREDKAAGPLLSQVDPTDSRIGISMSIVGESINKIYEELKEATDRSELVFGNLQEGVLAVDDRARVLLANRSLQRLLELSEEPYLYRPFLEVVRAPVVCGLIESVLKNGSPRDEQVELGSQPSYLHILARPLPLGQSRHGALITVRDETIIKRVELIRRDFISNASHELKTPLAAIRAYAETLQLGAWQNKEATANFLSTIVAQADRMNMLLQGMLQLSRAEVGGALHFERMDAREALQPCLTSAEALAQAKDVTVSVDCAEKPHRLESDRDAFQTIASNLLSNAVRYTQAGGNVYVRLTMHATHLTLEVRDTGIGMQQVDLERAFERFYRAQKDRSPETGGTGLGLSMVKHLTQALGGTVSACSEPNRGSTFVVRLPLQRMVE